MKSSSGAYYVGLDHVRALAVLLVWTWHFIQIHEIPTTPVFPLSILSEGHSGVAIFMTLSGYLFAKLLAGKRINYPAFIFNRVFRLLPLLLFVIAVVGLERVFRNGDLIGYASTIAKGLVLPTLPNGGWSITVEFHFYLLLPLLLILQARSKYALVVVLAIAIVLRAVLYEWLGGHQSITPPAHVESIQHYLSFFTLVGRIDQFLLGIIAYQFQAHVRGRHFLALATAVSFLVFQAYFDSLGGYDTKHTAFWIVLPTVEGLTFGLLIAWYDTSVKHSTGTISKHVAAVGTYSYSIYLLHFFVVWELSTLINKYVWDLSNIYMALFFGLVTFPIMYYIGSVSYRVIELPFLSYRKKYIITDVHAETPARDEPFRGTVAGQS